MTGGGDGGAGASGAPGARAAERRGPLKGFRVVEVAAIGPGPFAAMLLGDLGADVLRVERPGGGGLRGDAGADILLRNRRVVTIDLKSSGGVDALLRIVEAGDALVEGFRPGVAERLGFGPDVCLSRNPRLVYGRITGWGQDGPLAHAAGHDINYIALAGALHAIGRADSAPVPPQNLVADFGGGGMLLALGVVCALLETSRSGRGQVVDAAMVDGVAAQLAMMLSMRNQGAWSDRRGSNLLDTGAPFYEVYETADSRFIAVGALEPQFYAELLDRCGLDAAELPPQLDPSGWPEMKARFAALFRTRTRDEWSTLLEGTDACVTPVLTIDEAHAHQHLAERRTFVAAEGGMQPAPAPRFSRTPGSIRRPPGAREGAVAALVGWGLEPKLAERLGGDELVT